MSERVEMWLRLELAEALLHSLGFDWDEDAKEYLR